MPVFAEKPTAHSGYGPSASYFSFAMKILLLGEYSNVHHTLALGLRSLGHEVTVASNGDGWKSYPRDIDLRRPSKSVWHGLYYYLKMRASWKRFSGYDVVQLINPIFLDLKAERHPWFYRYLRQHNKRVVLGAFGMDHYYVKACLDFKTFRYSDFNMGQHERHSADNDEFKRDWLHGAKGLWGDHVVHDADAIVAGLYEYYVSYQAHCPCAGKLHFIPFPIVCGCEEPDFTRQAGAPLRIFIGVQRARSVYKGTDIMLRAVERLERDFPDEVQVARAESVPFSRYVEMMEHSEVILDQLYSYTPAMNALEAMSRGLITVGGGEPEHYQLLGESTLRPIINVQPHEQSVYEALVHLLRHRDTLVPQLRRESVLYVRRHHDHIRVARAYESLYRQLLNP